MSGSMDALALRGALAIFGLAASAIAAADAPPAPAPGSAVRVVAPEPVRGARLVHEGPGDAFSPPNPPATVPLGTQALEAYGAAAARLFGEGPTRGELEVLAARGELALATGGWKAIVEHDVVLRDVCGDEIGRWTARAEAPFFDSRAGVIPAAFARAARDAAAHVERRMLAAPAVERWIASRGAAFAPAANLQRERTRTPRARLLAILEGHAWILPEAQGAAARAGVAAPGLLAAVGIQRWGNDLAWRSPLGVGNDEADVRLTAVDVDLGAVLRLLPALELSAGVGASWVVHEVTARFPAGLSPVRTLRIEEGRWVRTVFAAAHYAVPVSGRFRARVGLELRKRNLAPVRFEALDASLAVKDPLVRFVLGGEFALAR